MGFFVSYGNLNPAFMLQYYGIYCNDPKFSDRYENSADPDQTAPRGGSSLIRVYTVCHSVCIVWTRYSMVEPHSSNFRVITTNFLGVRIIRKFTVLNSLGKMMTKPCSLSFPLTHLINSIIHEHSNRSHVMRKPTFAICEQQSHRSACASTQSDHCLCCSLPG